MRSLMKYLLILGLLPAFLLTSCKKESTTPEVDEFSVLANYINQNGLDMDAMQAGTDGADKWVTSAGGLNVNQTDYSVPDYYIIDLRSADAFANGHIKGAHNVPNLADLLVEAEKANGQKILTVCYTGQTSARATAALRLMGYKAKSLKWGMAGWHNDFAASWENNYGDISSPNWVKNGEPAANTEHGYPSFKTGSDNGPEILRERVQWMLGQSGWGVANADVLANPNNYFIVNKWSRSDWDKYGHIAGAHLLDSEISIDGLKWLDPSKKILVYCYTGQTSSLTVAWLQTMGYDAVSLKFGVNAINHSELVAGYGGVSWKGEGSGWSNNFGYYDSSNTMHNPN